MRFFLEANKRFSGMYLAQAQPDFRPTENFLSLNSGSHKIAMVKIILLPNSVLKKEPEMLFSRHLEYCKRQIFQVSAPGLNRVRAASARFTLL